MTQSELAYRWSRSEFVRAWEAGAFDHRVELIGGEVWPVVTGSWHGDTVGQLMAALPRDVVYEHTEPRPTGFRTRVEYRLGERIPVAYAGTDVAVDDLIVAT